MVRTAAAAMRQQERAKQRREQVLDAARKCVRSGGFHASSMSQIASEAGMSVGHIYQYFENKDAIIREISQIDFDEFMARISAIDLVANYDVDDFVSSIMNQVEWLLDADRAGITREVIAEASRNSQIRDILEQFNHRFREIVGRITRPLLVGFGQEDIDMRVEMMLVLSQTLPLHAGMHPAGNDRLIMAGYEFSLRSLLAKAPCA